MRAAVILVLVGLFGLCGCAALDFGELVRDAGPVADEELAASYDRIKIGQSDVAEVLMAVHRPEQEVLSQSKSVIASQGQNKRKHKIWFNMVAFDEMDSKARSKYLFIVNERPKQLFVEPWTGLRFDAQVIMDEKVLSEPYADNDAKLIAIVEEVRRNMQSDMDEVREDNKLLDVSGMMVRQSLQAVLVKLAASPVLAGKLGDFRGLEFD